jgi:hypothetical protein
LRRRRAVPSSLSAAPCRVERISQPHKQAAKAEMNKSKQHKQRNKQTNAATAAVAI